MIGTTEFPVTAINLQQPFAKESGIFWLADGCELVLHVEISPQGVRNNRENQVSSHFIKSKHYMLLFIRHIFEFGGSLGDYCVLH